MGCLWIVGSIKLYVSFAKETYKRDDILQKRPIILSILLTVATDGVATRWAGYDGVATKLKKVKVSFAEYRLFYRALLQFTAMGYEVTSYSRWGGYDMGWLP